MDYDNESNDSDYEEDVRKKSNDKKEAHLPFQYVLTKHGHSARRIFRCFAAPINDLTDQDMKLVDQWLEKGQKTGYVYHIPIFRDISDIDTPLSPLPEDANESQKEVYALRCQERTEKVELHTLTHTLYHLMEPYKIEFKDIEGLNIVKTCLMLAIPSW